MQYELYIDIFFLVNFMMDYLVLLIVRRILKCNTIYLKIILAAMVGTILSILLILIQVPKEVKQIILHFAGSLVMVKIAFGISGRKLLQGWCIFYFVGMLMGGIFLYLRQYIGKGMIKISLFLIVSLATYFLTRKITDYMGMYWKKRSSRCVVTVQIGKEEKQFSAFVDTGNMLNDMVSGKPVHVISSKGIKKFTEDIFVVRYVPYQTIQGEHKVMPLIQGNKMYIHGKKEQLIENPYIAVADSLDFGNGDYELILHPDCI